MEATNYCAHAIDDLRRLVKVAPQGLTLNTISALIPKLRKSIKFRVPDYGRIFDLKKTETIGAIIDNYCPVFRLPYPVIALEWSVPDCSILTPTEAGQSDPYDAIICVAYEEERGGEIHIIVCPMFRAKVDGRSQWFPLNFGAAISAGNQDIRPFPATENGLALGPNHPAVWSDLRGELTTFAQFMAALACSNSVAVDAPAPSASLNAKRKSSGKTPFFSYKELTISASGSPTAGASMGGTHGSPRVHLRRGHIRRLPERTVWVNACVVGDKSKGMVTKNYRVTA